MYYVTELVEQILTSDKGKDLLDSVPPIYSDGYVALWLFQTLGAELDGLYEHIDEIELQTNPINATWSLGYWEDALGLKTNDDFSDERRRAIIIEAWRHNSMPPARLEEIIKGIAGVDATITECTDAEGNESPYSFLVTLSEEISESLMDEVKNKIDSVKPSHLVYDVVVAD